MKTIAMSSMIALLAVGCASGEKRTANTERQNEEAVERTTHTESDMRRRSEDRTVGVAADDQAKGSRNDTEITRRIREELMEDDMLSTMAQNVTIVTLDSEVTLRGKVKSKAERERVVSIAREVVGANDINNQLTVTK